MKRYLPRYLKLLLLERSMRRNCKFQTFEIICFHDFLNFSSMFFNFSKHLKVSFDLFFVYIRARLCLARLEIWKSFATLITETKFKSPPCNPYFSGSIPSKTLLDFNNLRALKIKQKCSASWRLLNCWDSAFAWIFQILNFFMGAISKKE